MADEETPALLDRLHRAILLMSRRSDDREAVLHDRIADVRTVVLDAVGQLRDDIDELKRKQEELARNMPQCGAQELGSAIRTHEYNRKKQAAAEALALPPPPSPPDGTIEPTRERKATPTGVHVTPRGNLNITGIPIKLVLRWILPLLGAGGVGAAIKYWLG